MKILKLGTKNAFWGVFGVRILKNNYHISNEHPRIWGRTKFREKMKIPKFGGKNFLFQYFGARILKKYCHI